MYRSDDGGLHWRSTTGDSVSANTAELAVSPRSPDVVVLRAGFFGSITRTDDGGRSWSAVPGVSGIGALVFVPGRDGRVVAGNSRGDLLVSDDDGRTFRVQAAVPGTAAVTAIATGPDYPSDHTVVVNTYVKGSCISRDGGASFTSINRGLELDAVGEGNKVLPLWRMHNVVFSPEYGSDHTIFTATWIRFVKSVDGGRTCTCLRRFGRDSDA